MSEQTVPNPFLAELAHLRGRIDQLERLASETKIPSWRDPRPIEILQVVADVLDLPPQMISAHDQHPEYVEARHITMYLCRKLTHLSCPQIGRAIGKFHHTSVINGSRTCESRMAKEPDFKTRVDSVMEKLK